MSQVQLTQLASLIYGRSGIRFKDGKKYILESRLRHRLGEPERDRFDQYIVPLSMGGCQQDKFQEMSNRIMVNETRFFLNNTQLDMFDCTCTSRTARGSGTDQRRLRIRLAACSMGNVPVTITT